ncbi:uncharacterized protein LTR77_003466 [Saxophila tyrrhenica]|uniref:Uncharacterized protein n=1 Tax=Saxophila tyrrhenica TaxID=1690608 RepID=A0AAV9PE15_9PEZI|nr:hypothetical protein LTR77_003466 [Saxophila tyrrhenica]
MPYAKTSQESSSNVSAQQTSAADAAATNKLKRRSLLPQFNRKCSSDDKVELGIREEDEDCKSRPSSGSTRDSSERSGRRGIDEDRKAMPPPSRLSRPTSMVPPRGASMYARTHSKAQSGSETTSVTREDTEEDLEAARAQSLAALTGAAPPAPQQQTTSGSSLQRTGSTRLPQSPRAGGPAIPSRTTSNRTSQSHSRTISSALASAGGTSIAGKRSSMVKARAPSNADQVADAAAPPPSPRSSISSVTSRPRPSSQVGGEQVSPPRANGTGRPRPTSQMMPPPARPAFSTYQQHYSPAKAALPKPPVPSGKAPKPTSAPESSMDMTFDVAKQQIELLQLSLMHQASSKCMQEYTASARRKLGKKHTKLRKDYEGIRATELVQQRTANLSALETWCRDPSMLVENLQILSLVYSDLTSLIGDGSRHADMVSMFELWMNEAEAPEAGTFLQPLPDDWRTAHASLALKLRSVQRNLRVLPPPSDTSDSSSGLAVVLKGCETLVDGMLRELEMMMKLEKELLTRDRSRLEEDVKVLVLDDLKCSEETPVCAQCTKANRECLPASGVTFRHQQNPSMNGADHGEGSLKNFYGYRETFAKATTWVDVPKDLTFVHTNNPYEDEENGQYMGEVDNSFHTPAGAKANQAAANDEEYELARQLAQAAYPAYATQGLEALSAVASRDQYSYAPPPAPMGQQDQQLSGASPQSVQANASRNLDHILNPASGSGNIDPRLHSELATSPTLATNPQPDRTPEHVRTASYSSSYRRPSLRAAKGPDERHFDRRQAVESPELGFLLRDFSERCGLWMDLFDLNLFFATAVPVLSVKCPLLMYSCVALSAKSLARVGGRRPVMGGQVEPSRRSKIESWPDPEMADTDWYNKAREYYDLAVSLLRQALAGGVRPLTSSFPEHASPSSITAAQRQPLPTPDSDELVAATAILCVYEFLDASTPEWSRHLDGAKSLFDIANDRMMHLTQPPSPNYSRTPASHVSSNADLTRRWFSPGRKAVFWCFARQDMLSAFINNTHTRLDTFDLDLWRGAGLKITSDGFICPSNSQQPDYHPDNAMSDDMVSNGLVWLMAKLVNFIAAGDAVPEGLSPFGLGMRQRELLEYWEKLDSHLRAWHDGLPDSFHPTAVLSPQTHTEIEEKWYPRPLCASSAQWWHFARIQLLHNKPHVTTATAPSATRPGFGNVVPGNSLAARHASYSSILQQSREHAKEIVAIGLGRSDEGARVHSVQPLWSAGLVLGGTNHEDVSDETWMWRRSVVSQLRGIEHDMGWASGYRVQSLLELWGLSSDWGEEG